MKGAALRWAEGHDFHYMGHVYGRLSGSISCKVFEGKEGEDGHLWLRQLERAIRMGACVEAQCLDFALFHMKGAALRWAEGHDFTTWDTFMAGFQARFRQVD